MGPRRLLIATGEAASDTSEPPFGTQLLIDAADEILVIVPALPTRLAWLASDTDKTRQIADRAEGVEPDQRRWHASTGCRRCR